MSVTVTPNTKPNLVTAYATPDPKVIWIDGPRIVVYTGVDMPPQPPTAAERQAAFDAAEPLLADVRDQAQGAFDANTTYLAIGSPTTPQQTAQLRALTQQMNRVIRAVARDVVKSQP